MKPTKIMSPGAVGQAEDTANLQLATQTGITLFMTGLSAAGKSSLAVAVSDLLKKKHGREATILDGDIVRKKFSANLGYSKEDRDKNILYVASVAQEVASSGGIAICAVISPYIDTRGKVRELLSGFGGFLEVYVSTPIEVCEKRDPKGLYAKARTGEITNFTGVNDPYEPPTDPDISINCENLSPEEGAEMVLVRLDEIGLL